MSGNRIYPDDVLGWLSVILCVSVLLRIAHQFIWEGVMAALCVILFCFALGAVVGALTGYSYCKFQLGEKIEQFIREAEGED